MNKLILVLLSILIIIVNISCKKREKGKVTIIAFPKHHEKNTRPYRAFIKSNTQEFPGTNPTNYDLEIVADTTKNFIKIESLNSGEHYIYMNAFDTSIPATVIGGIPINITQTEGELNIDIPVTE